MGLKHAHKFLLIDGRTWKCMDPSCNWFVHYGLRNIIVGKKGVCWNCEEEFVVSEASMKDGKPKCDDCRLFAIPSASPTGKRFTINISEEKRKLNDEMFGRGNWEHAFEENQIEVFEPSPEPAKSPVKEKKLHAPDCASWLGAECNCR